MTQTLSLTPEQRDQFVTDGLVRVPNVVPHADIELMADRLWSALATIHGVVRDRPETWTKAFCAHFGKVARSGAFAETMSLGLKALLDDFFRLNGWDDRLPLPPSPLPVTFACGRGAWSIPSRSWHLDLGRAADQLQQAAKLWPDYARIFTYLAPVEPGGGGTVYVAGSHRAVIDTMADMAREGVGELRSAAIIKRLKTDSPWIAGLYSPGAGVERIARYMETGAELRGTRLHVAEMTGQPGDVVLWHPALLHSLAPNCRDTPRLMLSVTVYAMA